jgi:hypothetical protein
MSEPRTDAEQEEAAGREWEPRAWTPEEVAAQQRLVARLYTLEDEKRTFRCLGCDARFEVTAPPYVVLAASHLCADGRAGHAMREDL